MVLIKLNAIFSFKICCNYFSYENLYWNVGIIVASGLWSFLYSIHVQIRWIPATYHHFHCEKSILIFETSLPQTSKQKKVATIKYFKTLRNMIISTASTKLFESFTFFQSGWDYVFEIWEFVATSRTYSRPILRSTIEHCPLLRK